MAVKIPLGNIVLVRNVPDKQGGNHKDRFVVLVKDYDDADTDILGVAITGTFTFPLPSTSVKMTSRKDGNCKTRLNKPCIADCTWRVVAVPGDIIKKHDCLAHRAFAPPDSGFEHFEYCSCFDRVQECSCDETRGRIRWPQ